MRNSRNLGIDILRIVSMLGVVLLHVLGHGGILKLEHSSANFLLVFGLEILAYPAVNCFVLISGYVGYKGKEVLPKMKNLFTLMFTVIFYSVSLFLIFTLLGHKPFELTGLVRSFMPTMLNRYWFFSAYFGLFLLSPLLNLLVYKSNLKHAFVFLITFLLFCIISAIRDTFSLSGGYSLIWFIFIYSIGAIIKKYNLNKLLSRNRWLIVALSAFIITLLLTATLHFIKFPFIGIRSDMLMTYVSPLIVIMSVGWLNFFSLINCPPSFAPIITFFASSAFSVYLIHDNIYVRKYLVSRIHEFIGDYNFVLLALSIICIVGAIFLTCILIDKIRITIFNIIKIKKITGEIEEFIKKILNAIYIKFQKIVLSDG